MVTRVGKFVGGFNQDVTNTTNAHATENRVAFGHGDTNPTANVHVVGDILATTTVTATGGFIVPDDGDVGSASATDAMQISSAGIVTFKDDIKIKDGGTIGSATTPAAITVASDGIVTFADDIKIKNDGTIGSAGAATAMTIDSSGIVSFVDDIKIKDGGTIGSATTADAITVADVGAITLADDLAVTGNAIVTLGLGVAGNTAPEGGSFGGISLGTPANVVIRTGGSAKAGNVIIGDPTATTGVNLDVRGSANTGAITATTITLSADGGVIVPNDGNIGSTGATDAMQISSAGIVTFVDDIKIKDDGTIGSASAATAMTIDSSGIVTFVDDIKIKDGGTIGSASDADSISIASTGKVTLTQDLILDPSSGISNVLLDSDGSGVKFGEDAEITLLHVHDTGLLLTDSGGSPTLQLHDANESISSDGSKLILTSNGVAFNLPTADGNDGQVLTTDGSRTLSFADAAAGDLNPATELASDLDCGTVGSGTQDAFGQATSALDVLDLLTAPSRSLGTVDQGALS